MEHKFVIQEPNALDCGAFSLAYYLWLSEKEAAPGCRIAQKKFIQDIYAHIQFKDEKYTSLGELLKLDSPDVIRHMSNPLKMLDYITEALGINAFLFVDKKISKIDTAFSFIQTIDKELYKKHNERIKEEEIPPLQDKQFAIAVVEVVNGSLHYVLFNKISEDNYHLYDPASGKIITADETQLRGEDIITSGNGIEYKSLNTCILFE
jgi:hypothetical protein